MVVDPGHEFMDVLCQLCGPGASYIPGGGYPPINDSGFMASYAEACIKAKQTRNAGEILKCYSPNQLTVLNALAREFVVCDNWHASMPGPTWLIMMLRPCCVFSRTRSQSNHRRDSPLGVWNWLLLPEWHHLRPDQCQPQGTATPALCGRSFSDDGSAQGHSSRRHSAIPAFRS